MILMYIFMILITDLILMFRRGKNNNDITTTNSLYDFSIFFKNVYLIHNHSVTLNRKPYNERLTAVGSNRFSKTYFTMVPIHRLLQIFLFLWMFFNIQILIRKCLRDMKRTRRDLTN